MSIADPKDLARREDVFAQNNAIWADGGRREALKQAEKVAAKAKAGELYKDIVLRLIDTLYDDAANYAKRAADAYYEYLIKEIN